jgi:peptidoglycan/LPS O-acetylase OafA/YrhL
MFFTLSGFVLSLGFIRGGGMEALRSAAARRYFRLALPILFSTLASYALLRLGFYANRAAAEVADQSPEGWLGQWFAFDPSLPGAIDEGLLRALFSYDAGRTYNNVLWTMQAEFAGSLFIFGFHALVGRLRHRAVVYGGLGIVFLRFDWVWASAFLVGAALCDWCSGRLTLGRSNLTGLVLVISGLLLGGTTPEWVLAELGPSSFAQLLRFHTTAGAGLVLFGAVRSGWIQWLLHRRPLVFLGRLSFPLYLAHVPIELSLGCHLYLARRMAGGSHADGFIGAAAATVAGSFLIAWIGAMTVEPMSIRLGRWVYVCFFKPDGQNVRVGDSPRRDE